MAEHLLLRLEAPLMAFGAPAVDQRRPIQRWPATSLLTGLLANALGWRRTDAQRLNRLQQRLRWAARVDRPGLPLTDFQTARLSQADVGWTTHGRVEERAGGADTYNSPHIRWRELRADASVAMAVRLEDAAEAPSIAELAAALTQPARPLFIGRKHCIPSAPVFIGVADTDHGWDALATVPLAADASAAPAVFWRDARMDAAWPDQQALRVHHGSDERRFELDVHAGQHTIHELDWSRWEARP